MDLENLEKITVNLESSDAKEVGKNYIKYHFIESQIDNVFWLPAALALAYALYATACWILSNIQ